jgi:hypothetical protein
MRSQARQKADRRELTGFDCASPCLALCNADSHHRLSQEKFKKILIYVQEASQFVGKKNCWPAALVMYAYLRSTMVQSTRLDAWFREMVMRLMTTRLRRPYLHS